MTRAVNLLKLRISPLPGEESESGPDPSLLVSDPEDKGTRVSPVPSGPFFQGPRDSSRPPDGPCRADDSVQSNGSGDSDHRGQRSAPPYVRLAPLLRRVQTLESKVRSLQVTLHESFGVVRGELNEVWAELSDLRQATPPLDPGSASSPMYFQERRQNSTSAAGASTLSPASFQYLMRQVIDELCLSGCVFRTDPDTQTSGGVQAETINQIVEQVSAQPCRVVWAV